MILVKMEEKVDAEEELTNRSDNFMSGMFVVGMSHQ